MNVAKPLRMALGALIIQTRFQYSDRELVQQITENPYLQYFIGLPGIRKLRHLMQVRWFFLESASMQECSWKQTSICLRRISLIKKRMITTTRLHLPIMEPAIQTNRAGKSEGTCLQDAVNAYYERTGYYPERIPHFYRIICICCEHRKDAATNTFCTFLSVGYFEV